MTANHAHKKSLRKIQEEISSSGQKRYSYERLERIAAEKRAEDIRVQSAKYDEQVLRAASYALMMRSNVVVFGTAGAGKTAVAHGVMELLPGIPRVYFDTDRHDKRFTGGSSHHLKTDDSSYSVINCSSSFPDIEQELATLDEISAEQDLTSIASHATLMLTIHSSSRSAAQYRIESFTGLSLTDALYLKVSRDRSTGLRSVKLA